MHPIEATLYYTAAFIPVAFGLHPVFAVGTIVDCAIGAWLGHDGFQWPGKRKLRERTEWERVVHNNQVASENQRGDPGLPSQL